jgi:hypothetical protein
MTRLRTLMTAGAVTALMVGSTVSSATAAPLERRHIHDMFSAEIEDFCGELTVRLDIEADLTLLANPHGSDGLIYFLEAGQRTFSVTNLANDKTWTSVFNGVSKDLDVTDNGDGTLTVLAMDSGGGTTWYEFLVDHGGTPTDPTDDQVLDFRVVKGEITDACPEILASIS